MIDSVPALAPTSPPLTGASSMLPPRAATCSPIRRAAAAAIVLMSMTSTPGFAPAITPFSPSTTDSTSGASGSMVMTMSLASPTSAGDAAARAPAAASSSIAAWLRLNTVTGKPAFNRFSAIGLPIRPRPITPTETEVSVDTGDDSPDQWARAGRRGLQRAGQNRYKTATNSRRCGTRLSFMERRQFLSTTLGASLLASAAAEGFSPSDERIRAGAGETIRAGYRAVLLRLARIHPAQRPAAEAHGRFPAATRWCRRSTASARRRSACSRRWSAIPGPTISVLMPFATLDLLVSHEAALEKDQDFVRAADLYLNSPATDASYVRRETSLLHAFPNVPKIEVPAATATKGPRLLELRCTRATARWRSGRRCPCSPRWAKWKSSARPA